MASHDETPPYKFCPVCGSPLDSRVLRAGEPKRLVCTNAAACGFVFYLDPKVAVGTIIRTAAGKIVLVKRAIEPGFGQWVFPGGFVDRGEEIRLAAAREAREEAGITIQLDHLVGIYSYEGVTPIIIVFAATMTGGELTVDDENSEIREFAVDDIPWDELAFRSTVESLEDYIKGVTALSPH